MEPASPGQRSRSQCHQSTWAAVDHLAVIIIEGERDFCAEDPDPYVVALTCAIGDRRDWAAELARGDWRIAGDVAKRALGLDDVVTPELVARVVYDALDDATFALTNDDNLLIAAELAVCVGGSLGDKLMTQVEWWLHETEDDEL